MGEWRFYAKRPAQDRWLDTNVQIDPVMTWSLNASFAGQAIIPNGIGPDKGPDKRDMWGRGDTLLLGEEDNQLAWAGICSMATPGREGLYLEFTGAFGWMNNLPYLGEYEVNKADVFDVVRHLITAGNKLPRTLNVVADNTKSQFTAGGTKGDYPEAPVRHKGQTTKEYEESGPYKAWLAQIEKYEANLGVGPYTLAWWEAPYIGEEISTMADEYGFDFRERVKWKDRRDLDFEFRLDFADDLTKRRTDIVFEEGVNLASRAQPKEDSEPYATHVIGLGAGEGRDMVRAEHDVDDPRLYSARYMNYKTVTNADRLRSLTRNDARRFSGNGASIESVQVWDTPGFAPIGSLKVGDECRVISHSSKPPYDIWHRVREITRTPSSAVVDLSLERRD